MCSIFITLIHITCFSFSFYYTHRTDSQVTTSSHKFSHKSRWFLQVCVCVHSYNLCVFHILLPHRDTKTGDLSISNGKIKWITSEALVDFIACVYRWHICTVFEPKCQHKPSKNALVKKSVLSFDVIIVDVNTHIATIMYMRFSKHTHSVEWLEVKARGSNYVFRLQIRAFCSRPNHSAFVSDQKCEAKNNHYEKRNNTRATYKNYNSNSNNNRRERDKEWIWHWHRHRSFGCVQSLTLLVCKMALDLS